MVMVTTATQVITREDQTGTVRWQAFFSAVNINADTVAVQESALAELLGSGKILVYEGMVVNYTGAVAGVKIEGRLKAQPVLAATHPYGILPKWVTAYATDSHDWSDAVRGRWEILEGKTTGIMMYFALDAHDVGNADDMDMSIHGTAYPPQWGLSVAADAPQSVTVDGYTWPLKRRY